MAAEARTPQNKNSVVSNEDFAISQKKLSLRLSGPSQVRKEKPYLTMQSQVLVPIIDHPGWLGVQGGRGWKGPGQDTVQLCEQGEGSWRLGSHVC